MKEDNNIDFYEDYDIMTLSLEDGEELECAVITIFALDDQDYIALLPMEEEDDETAQVLLYRYEDLGDNQAHLSMIASEEEFDQAAEAYYKLTEAYEEGHGHDDDCDCDHDHDCHCDHGEECDC